MKKYKFLVLIIALISLAITACGCGEAEPSESNTAASLQDPTALSNALSDTSAQSTAEAEETNPRFSAESNDLEIITFSKTEVSEAFTETGEAAVLTTEAVVTNTITEDETTAAQTESSEETRIELPFVPAV